MAEGKDLEGKPEEMEPQADVAAAKGGGGKKILFLIIILVVIAGLAAGGFFGYKMFIARDDGGGGENAGKEVKKGGKTSLFPIDPFVVNLSEPGRYLKVTMQFELAPGVDERVINEKIPVLRDIIITLIGNQTYEYAASAEGKIQLKEDILLRTNRLFGKEVFQNLYFTEFVMQ